MKKRGFTLIELVVVMAIIAVLALLVVGAILAARDAQTRTQNRSNGKTMQTAIEANFRNGQYVAASGTFEATKATYGAVLGATACSANGGGSVDVTTTGYVVNVYDKDCQVSPILERYCGPGACPAP